MMLKLVEEASYPVILLSTFDCLTSPLLSRIRTVIKTIDRIESTFSGIKAGASRMSEISEDAHYYERLRVMAQVSPILYYLEKKIKVTRNKERIFSILE